MLLLLLLQLRCEHHALVCTAICCCPLCYCCVALCCKGYAIAIAIAAMLRAQCSRLPIYNATICCCYCKPRCCCIRLCYAVAAVCYCSCMLYAILCYTNATLYATGYACYCYLLQQTRKSLTNYPNCAIVLFGYKPYTLTSQTLQAALNAIANAYSKCL